MGKPIKDLLMSGETLFKEERVFDLDHIPENFIHRDAQMEGIALCIRPALRGGRPLNARILGPPATGKTTAVKVLFDQVEATPEGQKVVCVHINSQIHSSKFAIFSQIHKKVLGHAPPETGVPFQRVYEQIFKKLTKDGKSLVVALDDMNYLFHDRHANDIIYDILKAPEFFPGVRTALFGILSDTEFAYKLEARVASLYKPQEVFFPPYSMGEMLDILRNRAKLGLYPGVASDEIIEKVATYASAHGDLRVGIELLRVSTLVAEADSSRKIEDAHVERAYERSRLVNLRQLLRSLDPEELELVKLVAGAGDKIDSGDLYTRFKDKVGQSYTKFYRILDKLESIRMIDTKFTGHGRKGRTRIITSRYGGDEITGALQGQR
ncbi:MAG: ORC1-type DNA replication protein [Euryarchaeota archaeon]|nr:ORC1-type DNA replication protein [Euryarchaeota archaeon]